jgi:hypothetical protein
VFNNNNNYDDDDDDNNNNNNNNNNNKLNAFETSALNCGQLPASASGRIAP